MAKGAIKRAMNLKEWRLTHGRTQAQTAAMFGIKHARNYQRYETGECLPDAPFVLRAIALSAGEVSAHDIYMQRAAWLEARRFPEAAE